MSYRDGRVRETSDDIIVLEKPNMNTIWSSNDCNNRILLSTKSVFLALAILHSSAMGSQHLVFVPTSRKLKRSLKLEFRTMQWKYAVSKDLLPTARVLSPILPLSLNLSMCLPAKTPLCAGIIYTKQHLTT